MEHATRLNGLHHITAITGDSRRNLDFYTGLMGLRLVAKSVNQDDPSVYHLYYGNEDGTPGAGLTFFEYPNAVPGRAGAGMVHRIDWRVGSREAIEFWAERLTGAGLDVDRRDDLLLFEDPEGLGHGLAVSAGPDAPLVASHPEIPAQLALQGFSGVRAYAADPHLSRGLLEGLLGASPIGTAAWELRGATRGGTVAYDPPPDQPGHRSAGTVHHVAWGTTVAEHAAWAKRLDDARVRNSGVIDRHYFHSIYFREPSGVLFEIADDAPGFSVDLPVEQLGTRVILPPWLEARRHELEARLTPLPDPRASWPSP